jgi:hypothetical protein
VTGLVPELANTVAFREAKAFVKPFLLETMTLGVLALWTQANRAGRMGSAMALAHVKFRLPEAPVNQIAATRR